MGGSGTGTIISDSTLVCVSDFKDHARIDATDEDTYLSALLGAVEDWCEKYQNRKYLAAECVDYLDAWPDVIRPRWSTLISVTSIKYIDVNGDEQTWSSSEYQVDTDTLPGRIMPAYNCSYPNIRGGDLNAITVTYQAGYGSDASETPASIRHAVMMIAAHLYENREHTAPITISEVPMGALSLLGLERLISI